MPTIRAFFCSRMMRSDLGGGLSPPPSNPSSPPPPPPPPSTDPRNRMCMLRLAPYPRYQTAGSCLTSPMVEISPQAWAKVLPYCTLGAMFGSVVWRTINRQDDFHFSTPIFDQDSSKIQQHRRRTLLKRLLSSCKEGPAASVIGRSWGADLEYRTSSSE